MPSHLTRSQLAHARYLGADAALARAATLLMTATQAHAVLDDRSPFDPPALASEPVDHASAAFADAWEEGRDTVWDDAVQAVALRVLGNIDRASAIEHANESYVRSLRTAPRNG